MIPKVVTPPDAVSSVKRKGPSRTTRSGKTPMLPEAKHLKEFFPKFLQGLLTVQNNERGKSNGRGFLCDSSEVVFLNWKDHTETEGVSIRVFLTAKRV